MTDFAELSLAPAVDDSAEDDVGFMGATLKPSSLKNLFRQRQLLPTFTATWPEGSEENEKRHSDDALTSRMKILVSSETHHDAIGQETRDAGCDSALLLQLRINAPSVSDWRRKHETAISNKGFDSASAWEAMSRRFQERLKA